MDNTIPRSGGLITTSFTPPGSNFSTPSTTPSTPTSGTHEFIGTYPSHSARHPLPPLAKEFPKPEREVDIEEALERQPGRWTFQGQVRENRSREQARTARADNKEQKLRDLKAAKRDLLGSHANLLQEAPQK